jgi:hypothetical protein
LTQKQLDPEALMADAKASRDKEVNRILDKTKTYRIGAGARADTVDASTFLVEVTICLSTENAALNMDHLEKTLRILRTLQARGYTLTLQDGNCILCETAKTAANLN